MGRFEQIQFGRINKTRLFISIFIIIYMGTASARRQSKVCSVERCHRPYARAMERLKSRGDNELRECKASLRYQKCLSRMRRSCRGHLLFHSMEHMNQNTLKRLNCTAVLAEHEKLMALSSHPDNNTHVPNRSTSTSTIATHTVRENSACTYKGTSTLKQCNLLENSKIQRYSGDLITCSLEGTWSLVDNDYLVVSVTFVKDENEPKSYASKISVLVRSAGECSQKNMYIATTDMANLPSAFTDGSTISGSIEVVGTTNRHVDIRAQFINTTITLRLLDSRLTVGVRMPGEFTESLRTRNQLCGEKHLLLPAVTKSHGSDSQDFNEKNGEIPRRRHYTHSHARQKCRKIMCNTKRKSKNRQNPLSKSEKIASGESKNTQSEIAQLILSKQGAEPLLVPKKRQRRGKEQKRCSQLKHTGNFKICFDTCVSDLVNFGRLNLTLIKNWLNNNSLPDVSSSLDYGNDVVPHISSDCLNTVPLNADRSNSSGVKVTSSSIFALLSYFLYFIVLYLQM